MQDLTTKNFGLLIAYVLPGFTLLWGASHHSITLQTWLGQTSSDLPTVGGFLYVTLGSVAAGMTASTVRWLLIDTLHHWTGLRQPAWDFSQLADRVLAFDTLIEIHYRFYQWHANMIVALLSCFMLRWTAVGINAEEVTTVILLCGLFFIGSRDTLRKYYARVAGVLGTNDVYGSGVEPTPENALTAEKITPIQR
ncbi:MAG: hypothetical protein KDA93_01710 [Planctomycetaceae bacterium]|nr:hypothetical protein [Planctomycetaceae bacterium]